MLAVADRPDVGIEPVPPNRAFRVLRHNTHRRRAMGQRDAHFRALAAMARQALVAWVTSPRHPFLLDALADRGAAHLHDAEAGRAGSAGDADADAPGPLKAAGNPKAMPVARHRLPLHRNRPSWSTQASTPASLAGSMITGSGEFPFPRIV